MVQLESKLFLIESIPSEMFVFGRDRTVVFTFEDHCNRLAGMITEN